MVKLDTETESAAAACVCALAVFLRYKSVYRCVRFVMCTVPTWNGGGRPMLLHKVRMYVPKAIISIFSPWIRALVWVSALASSTPSLLSRLLFHLVAEALSV